MGLGNGRIGRVRLKIALGSIWTLVTKAPVSDGLGGGG